MLSANRKIEINIGGLEGIASVYKHVSTGLHEFNNRWKKGEQSTVYWNIRGLRHREMDISAISFFIAIAHRVRLYTGCPQPILLDWNPNILSFLSDIGFFDVANANNLFKWPYEIDGLDLGKTNPNTKLLSYNQLSQKPEIGNTSELSNWKRIHREKYRADVISKCESLFVPEDQKNYSENLALVMSRTCAEIAINSLLWGESAAFLGIQRSGKRITISISDIGVGLKNSLISKGLHSNLLKNDNSDINSVALCCVINENDFGLKRAVSTVIRLGGHISISSSSGEILWRERLWNDFVECYENKGAERAILKLPAQIYKAEISDRKNGYVRKWSDSIRGTRVSFMIPVNQ